MYADYAFYTDEYAGSLISDANSFARTERKAAAELDRITFGRISQADDTIRLAVCEMTEILYLSEERKNRHLGLEVESENNDGYSVTYAGVSGNSGQNQLDKELYRAAYRYLSRSGLMDWSVEE